VVKKRECVCERDRAGDSVAVAVGTHVRTLFLPLCFSAFLNNLEEIERYGYGSSHSGLIFIFLPPDALFITNAPPHTLFSSTKIEILEQKNSGHFEETFPEIGSERERWFLLFFLS